MHIRPVFQGSVTYVYCLTVNAVLFAKKIECFSVISGCVLAINEMRCQ